MQVGGGGGQGRTWTWAGKELPHRRRPVASAPVSVALGSWTAEARDKAAPVPLPAAHTPTAGGALGEGLTVGYKQSNCCW